MQNSDCKITISCHGYAALLAAVENNRRHNQNHGSRKNKYFFLISRRIILDNHGLRLLMKSRFTRKKNKPFHESQKYPTLFLVETIAHRMRWVSYPSHPMNVLRKSLTINDPPRTQRVSFGFEKTPRIL